MLNQMLSEIHTLLKKIHSEKNLDTWMTIKEACEYCRLSEPTLRRNIRFGSLKVSKRTGRLLFKKSEIDKWLKG